MLAFVGCEKGVAVLKQNLTRARVPGEVFASDEKLHPSFFKVMERPPDGGRRVHQEGWFVNLAMLCQNDNHDSWSYVVTRISSCIGGQIFVEDVQTVPWLYRDDPVVSVSEPQVICAPCEELTTDLSSSQDIPGVQVEEVLEQAVGVVEAAIGREAMDVVVHNTEKVLCSYAPVQGRFIVVPLDMQLFDEKYIEEEKPGDVIARGRPYRIRFIKSQCGVCLYGRRCDVCRPYMSEDYDDRPAEIVFDLVRDHHTSCAQMEDRVDGWMQIYTGFGCHHKLVVSPEMIERFGRENFKIKFKGATFFEPWRCKCVFGNHVQTHVPPDPGESGAVRSRYECVEYLRKVGNFEKFSHGRHSDLLWRFEYCGCDLCARANTENPRRNIVVIYR
jgi:hypothetical protein